MRVFARAAGGLLLFAATLPLTAAAQTAPRSPTPPLDPAKITVPLTITYIYRWSRIMRLTLTPGIPITCAANPVNEKLTSCVARVPIGTTVKLTGVEEPAGGSAGWVYKPPLTLSKNQFPAQCKSVDNGWGCQVTVSGPMTLALDVPW